MALLEIKDLHVSVEGKEILKGITLTIQKGTIHALMGPNGSGKSTLAQTVLGHPRCIVTKGTIRYEGKDILSLAPHERARLGLFLSFQYPAEISGISVSNFLRTAYHSLGRKKMSILEFQKYLEEKMKLLKMDKQFLARYLNEGFSGGEKKRAETLQLLSLDPTLAILDEIDSGLDIDALKSVSHGINAFMNNHKALLVITHYKRMLEYVKPHTISIIIDGKIVLEGDHTLAADLEKKGYGWIEEA